MPHYNVASPKAQEFIDDAEIRQTMAYALENANNIPLQRDILAKGQLAKGLDHREAAVLLVASQPDIRQATMQLANDIKLRFYGKRIVLFAPLYLSNHCVNGCLYCPYHASNRTIPRHQLTQEQIRQEVTALQAMGHKRLALEMGEDPTHNTMDYLLEAIQTIYATRYRHGAIRRVNVNVAATTVENYARMHQAGIGTYILFQETYHQAHYQALHPNGPKSHYAYHTEAMDRAMQGGIDDVGLGVLFGLNTYLYDFIGLLMHAEHLEACYGVGPHTLSVPRICPADGISLGDFPNAVPDDVFLHLIATARVAVPYTGIIVSTREKASVRTKALHVGVSQVSGGSKTTVGGYADTTDARNSAQFEVHDERTLDQVVAWLLDNGHIPSFCTACYRQGRTGDRFMALCKSGKISDCCSPNALLTLQEYIQDYASDSTRQKALATMRHELALLPNEAVKARTRAWMDRIVQGERDFRF